MYEIRPVWQPSSAHRTPVRVNPVQRHAQERCLSLDGPWLFRLDPKDEGVRLQWFRRPAGFRDTIHVPGTWQGQGFGHHGPDRIWDFGIEARVFRATYAGTGWYARRWALPSEWAGRRVWLCFGGVHPSADVWVNGRPLGTHSAPFVPFGFDVSGLVRPGEDNWVVVRVHEQNRWLGLAYNWQGCWSGLYRGVEVCATGRAWLDRFWIYPDAARRRVAIRVRLGGDPSAVATLAVAVASTQRSWQLRPGREAVCTLSVPEPALWSPDRPHLYPLEARLSEGADVLDALHERVGFVQLTTRGKHILINGEPYYLRGTGDFIVNPETASPDTDRQRWRRKLQRLRAFGYNYVRCQSYVPAPEYYDVADEVGLIVQSEMGLLGAWGGTSPWRRYPWPAPTAEFRHALKWQWDRTVMRDVNHPSALIYCMSNELGAQTFFPRTAWAGWRATRAIRPNAVVLWTDGGAHRSLPGDFLNAEARLDRQFDRPVVQHEFRWWSSFPDVRLRRRYAGAAVRPVAIEIAEQAAARFGLKGLLPALAEASQRLQLVEARTKMENCRRDHPRLAGICHFNAMDAGLSPQGILDEFYERKQADAATWLRTNGDTVVLMDHDFDDRVLTEGDTFRVRFSVSDFSHPPWRRPVLEWTLAAGRRVLARGRLAYPHRPFCTCPAGGMQVDLPTVGRPLALTLQAVLREGPRTVRNDWSFWLLPRRSDLPTGTAVYGPARHTWLRTVRGLPRLNDLSGPGPRVLLTERLDPALVDGMHAGARVLLAAAEGLVRPFPGKLGLTDGQQYFFLPPANYPPLEEGHSGTIVARHPMLGRFPHQGFADFQFFRLIRGAPAIDLEPIGLGRLEPVIRAIHTYYVCRPLAYLVEAGVGRGGLVLCALNLDQRWPEAQYLLRAILCYMSGRAFRPRDRLTPAPLRRLLEAATF